MVLCYSTLDLKSFEFVDTIREEISRYVLVSHPLIPLPGHPANKQRTIF